MGMSPTPWRTVNVISNAGRALVSYAQLYISMHLAHSVYMVDIFSLTGGGFHNSESCEILYVLLGPHKALVL